MEDDFDIALALSRHISAPCSMDLLREYLNSLEKLAGYTQDSGTKEFAEEILFAGRKKYDFLKEHNLKPVTSKI
jgi:hypothetical protein